MNVVLWTSTLFDKHVYTTGVVSEPVQSEWSLNSSQLFVPKADDTCSRDWLLFKQSSSTYIEGRGHYARAKEAGYSSHEMKPFYDQPHHTVFVCVHLHLEYKIKKLNHYFGKVFI